MNKNACFIFSHENVKVDEELKHKLLITLMQLIIEKNVETFYFAGRKIYDYLCLKILLSLRIYYPQIHFILVENEYDFKMPTIQNKTPFDQEFLEIVYAYDFYHDYALWKNKFIIDKSDFIVFFSFPFKDGKTDKAYKYAIKKNRKVLFIKE